MLISWLSRDNKNIVYQDYGSVQVYGGGPQLPGGKFTADFIYAATANFRCPKAMVEVVWAESQADTSLVVSSNDINRIDRTGQLFNGETESGAKWAYLHTGLIADGSFKVMPELDTEPQMGWYGSAQVGDGSGVFSTPPYLTVTHDPRTYMAVTITGDSVYNEYPVDFTLTFTHSGGPTVIAVTGNTRREYSGAFLPILEVTAVKLTVTKWSAPNTIVKIIQFSDAFIERYRADDIIELNILEETNSDTGVVPIGNVSANELDLSLLNTDRRFSYGNTDSIYNTGLRSSRKILVWLGFILPVGSIDATGDVDGYIVETVNGQKIGYMPYGIYWSKDWITSYDSQVATTTAYDITYKLSQKQFLKSGNYSGTVQTIVDAVLTAAKADIPDLNWIVSADITGINWDNVAFEPKSYLDILKDIAAATRSYTYVNRNGLLVVGSRLEAIATTEAWQELGLSDYYNYQSNPQLDELINSIRVGYTRYIAGTPATSIYPIDEEFELPAGGTLSMYLKWSAAPVEVSTVALALNIVSGTPVISSLDKYAYGADITITGSAGDKFKITATGTPYTLEENTDTLATDEESARIYGTREFSLTGNILITNVEQAQDIANGLLSGYGEVRQDGSIQWPASTLLSVGDTLEVIEFKSATVETKDYFLIKRQNIKFTGAMQGQAELRRG